MTAHHSERHGMISVVVPLHDEEGNIARLHTELAAVAGAAAGPWEWLFVDDGSRDGTWPALVALCRRDARVRPVRLRRNFGQTAAMACGIEAARGEIIVTMDGDLQNDPADIPRLVATMAQGYDLVCGWRWRRQDDLWTRTVPSRIANRLIGWLTGVRLHDYGCSLKAYRAEAIKRTPLYAEFHRFIPALSTLTGALVTEIRVNHRPRRFGRTKYGLGRTWRVAFDMMTVALLVRFAVKPLRFFGVAAAVCLTASAACIVEAWSRYQAPEMGPFVSQVLPGVAMLGVWLGVHLVIVGLVAELLLATGHERPVRWVVAEGV